MNNSTNTRKNFLTPDKAASFIPVFISAGISILIITFVVIPQYIRSNKVNFELKDLIKKKNDLDNLKSQYTIINQKFEKLNKEKSKIIELVTGQSDLDTLLAKLGDIGQKNNIEFVSIVPTKLMSFVENDKRIITEKSLNNEELIIDPLLVEGSKKYLIEFTFKSEFTNLLSFLRDLEFQDNLIIVDEINLSLLNQNIKDIEDKYTNKRLDVKLSTTFYGKN